MTSANKGENPIIKTTTDAKTARGETAIKEATTAIGDMQRTAERAIGDGTNNSMTVKTHSDQPHMRSASDVAVDASSARICQGEAKPSTTHAATETPNKMRGGVIVVAQAMFIACPTEGHFG
jgi:hypothetical protein